MLQTMKKGFTLIELLVVITIIGILATGAVSVYTSQIAKARDTTRISDVKVIETAVVQASSDIGYFPRPVVSTSAAGTSDAFGNATVAYLNEIPTDPRSGQVCNNSICDYIYNTGDGGTGVQHSAYEISTAFESTANVTSKAGNDDGTDPLRMEFGDKSIATVSGTSGTAASANTTANCNLITGNGITVEGDCTP